MNTHYEGNNYPYGCIGMPFGNPPEEVEVEEERAHPLWVSHLVCLEDCRGTDDLEDALTYDEHSQWIRLPQ